MDFPVDSFGEISLHCLEVCSWSASLSSLGFRVLLIPRAHFQYRATWRPKVEIHSLLTLHPINPVLYLTRGASLSLGYEPFIE
jgi:hypothetical protein